MKVSQKDIFLGSDPEFFLTKQGEIYPAFNLLGSNENPTFTKDGQNSMYYDNILIEYTTTPSNSLKSWMHNQKSVLKEVQNKVIKLAGAKLVYSVSAEVPNDAMEDDRVHEFGCNPVLNVYDEENALKAVSNPFKLRFAGGHVHISYPRENIETTRDIIKKLDLHLGLPSLLIEPFNTRRGYYGKAGAFRRVPGSRFEYRTLSNFWLYHDNYLTWVYNTILKVVLDTLNFKMEPIEESLTKKVSYAINTGNTELALHICNNNNIKILKNETNIRLWNINEGLRKSSLDGKFKISRKSTNSRQTSLKGWGNSILEEN